MHFSLLGIITRLGIAETRNVVLKGTNTRTEKLTEKKNKWENNKKRTTIIGCMNAYRNAIVHATQLGRELTQVVNEFLKF